MVQNAKHFPDAASIAAYVLQTLCRRERLADDAYTLQERALMRSGRHCGVYYWIRGPRAMFLSAIWDAQAGAILFYGSRGERFQKTVTLAAAPARPQRSDGDPARKAA